MRRMPRGQCVKCPPCYTTALAPWLRAFSVKHFTIWKNQYINITRKASSTHTSGDRTRTDLSPLKRLTKAWKQPKGANCTPLTSPAVNTKGKLWLESHLWTKVAWSGKVTSTSRSGLTQCVAKDTCECLCSTICEARSDTGRQEASRRHSFPFSQGATKRLVCRRYDHLPKKTCQGATDTALAARVCSPFWARGRFLFFVESITNGHPSESQTT